jgi:hypothetical protein
MLARLTGRSWSTSPTGCTRFIGLTKLLELLAQLNELVPQLAEISEFIQCVDLLLELLSELGESGLSAGWNLLPDATGRAVP